MHDFNTWLMVLIVLILVVALFTDERAG